MSNLLVGLKNSNSKLSDKEIEKMDLSVDVLECIGKIEPVLEKEVFHVLKNKGYDSDSIYDFVKECLITEILNNIDIKSEL